MDVEREQTQKQSGFRNAGVGHEDGENTEQRNHDKQRLAADAEAQPTNVGGHVEPEDAQEELSERVEHFDEEVPPQPHVWRQVRQQKMRAVGRWDKFPAAHEQTRQDQQRPDCKCQVRGVEKRED